MTEEFKNERFFKENITKCAFFHKADDRIYWEKFKGKIYEDLRKEEEEIKDPIPVLKVSDFMKYSTEGDRMAMEHPYFKRRATLVRRCLLEAIENKGERINDILDVLFAILEETSWTVSAHYGYAKTDDIIPNEDKTCLDLFSGETGAIVSMVYYIHREKIDAVSLEFGNRVRRKIKQELFDNYLNNDYYWMGFGRIPNNWNPWITSNVLRSVICLEETDDYICTLLARCGFILEKYESNFPEDGGCDEGAGYWAHAGATYIMCMHFFRLLTGGKLDGVKLEKTRNISRFAYNTFVNHKQLLGFSDVGLNAGTDFGIQYLMGKITGDENLVNFAANLVNSKKNIDFSTEKRAISADRIIFRAEAYADLSGKKAELSLPCFAGYKSIGIGIYRETEKFDKGLMLAIKANHNHESHNHLDTGNIIVYKDASPFIIDVGARVYSKDTFSKLRYTFWNTRSKYHNLPVIGEYEEKPEREHEATNVEIMPTTFKANLEKAYDEEFIKEFVRKTQFNQGEIVLTDKISLTQEKEIDFGFMTVASVKFEDRKIILENNGKTLEIITDFSFESSIEIIEDNDEKINGSWENGEIKRISLKTRAKEKEFEFKIR